MNYDGGDIVRFRPRSRRKTAHTPGPDIIEDSAELLTRKRSAACAALSNEAKSLLGALHTIDSSGHENNDPILVEVTPGRFVKVKLSDKWRKFGAASSENIERARNIVDLAEAAFEADRAIKQSGRWAWPKNFQATQDSQAR
jgi:hypothetical protein